MSKMIIYMTPAVFIETFQAKVTEKVWEEMNFTVHFEETLDDLAVNAETILDVIAELSADNLLDYVNGECDEGFSEYVILQAWLLPLIGINDFLTLKVYCEYGATGIMRDCTISCGRGNCYFPQLINDQKRTIAQKFLQWLAVENEPQLLSKIPKKDITQTLATIAVIREPALMRFVPETIQLSPAVKRTVWQKKQVWQPAETYTSVFDLRYTIDDPARMMLFEEYLMTAEVAEMLIADNPENIAFLPSAIVPAKAYREAAFAKPSIFPFVPKALIDTELVEYVVRQQPELIFDVPKKFRTKLLWLQVIKREPELRAQAPKSIQKFMERIEKILIYSE